MKKQMQTIASSSEETQSGNRLAAIDLLRFMLEEFKRQSPAEFAELVKVSEFDFNPVSTDSGNITWLGNDESLRTFYNEAVLKEELFIAESEDVLKSHCTGKEVPGEKIIINKRKINEVIFLFKEFSKHEIKLIARDSYLHNLLAEHFLDEFGKELKRGSLKTIISRETCVRSKKRIEVLKEIVAKVKWANRGRPDYPDE